MLLVSQMFSYFLCNIVTVGIDKNSSNHFVWICFDLDLQVAQADLKLAT